MTIGTAPLKDPNRARIEAERDAQTVVAIQAGTIEQLMATVDDLRRELEERTRSRDVWQKAAERWARDLSAATAELEVLRWRAERGHETN
jgi:hypothetical protein